MAKDDTPPAQPADDDLSVVRTGANLVRDAVHEALLHLKEHGRSSAGLLVEEVSVITGETGTLGVTVTLGTDDGETRTQWFVRVESA